MQHTQLDFTLVKEIVCKLSLKGKLNLIMSGWKLNLIMSGCKFSLKGKLNAIMSGWKETSSKEVQRG